MREQQSGSLGDKIKKAAKSIRFGVPSFANLSERQRAELEHQAQRDLQATSSQGPVLSPEDFRKLTGHR